MSETKVTRRSRGEDAIYFAAAKNRYVGSVSLGNVGQPVGGHEGMSTIC
jgi:hypothetical protein